MAILFRCLLQKQSAGPDRKTHTARLKKLLVIRGMRMSAFMNVVSQFSIHPYMRLLPDYSAKYLQPTISGVGNTQPSGSWAA